MTTSQTATPTPSEMLARADGCRSGRCSGEEAPDGPQVPGRLVLEDTWMVETDVTGGTPAGRSG